MDSGPGTGRLSCGGLGGSLALTIWMSKNAAFLREGASEKLAPLYNRRALRIFAPNSRADRCHARQTTKIFLFSSGGLGGFRVSHLIRLKDSLCSLATTS